MIWQWLDISDIRNGTINVTYDGRGPNTISNESSPTCQIGPITIAMARKLQDDWNTVTDGRETYLYMLKTPWTLV